MLRVHLLVLCTCLFFIAHTQNIGGVVNSYYKVTAVDINKTYLQLENTSGLSKGDKVMIVQMKGATINTSNTSSFGMPTLNNAGDYELNSICNISGNVIYLANTLLNTYDVNGKVQVVRVPVYSNPTVTTLLTADPWDNTTGKGGVLAISVSGILTLNANISADGAGFKGGQFILSSGDCYDNIATDYFYNPSLTNYLFFKQIQFGAYKGESIADVAIQYQGGKGALASGGGGGNNHNNGGGGGGNLSTGGVGGANSSSAGCSGPNPGIGGYALSNNNNKKIFFGGGGGAGHGNNTAQTGGGNGGGIIFIEATTLTSNSYKISADGANGSSTTGDGASGGGAGGTIIISAGSYSGQPLLSVKGGKGGDENEIENPTGRCFGAGGGGSGGVIFFKGTIPTGTITLDGGLRGEKLNSQCPTANLATAGVAGLTIPNYDYLQATTSSNNCPANIALPVTLLSFKAYLGNNRTTLEWQVADTRDAQSFTVQRMMDNENFKDIGTVAASQSLNYQYTDNGLVPGKYLYRLKITEHSGVVTYSPTQMLTVKNNNAGQLVIYPNPATQAVVIINNFKKGDVLTVYDVAGRVVLQKTIASDAGSVNQNIGFLKKGIYQVQCGRMTTSLIVQ